MNQQCYYRVSVKGIAIDSEGRVLLAREENGHWEMLGGGLEHNEDPIEGLKREIYEETGLNVVKISNAPKYFLTAPLLQNNTYMANIVYEIELENLDLTPSDECHELRFFTLEEMATIDLFPNGQKLLRLLTGEQ